MRVASESSATDFSRRIAKSAVSLRRVGIPSCIATQPNSCQASGEVSPLRIRDFWDQTFLVPRLALVCAAVALACNLASFAGLGMRGPFEFLGLVHLVLMALGLACFVRVAQHNYWRWRAGAVQTPPFNVPRIIVFGAASALMYLLALGYAGFAIYGEGYPERRDGCEVWVIHGTVTQVLAPGSIALHAARELRFFSAAWLFFALDVAAAYDHVERRLLAYRAACNT